jgi:hypothetical protein
MLPNPRTMISRNVSQLFALSPSMRILADLTCFSPSGTVSRPHRHVISNGIANVFHSFTSSRPLEQRQDVGVGVGFHRFTIAA